MIDPQEKELLCIYREIKDWGFGEINIKFADNKVASIKSSKSYKPVEETVMHIKSTRIVVEKVDNL